MNKKLSKKTLPLIFAAAILPMLSGCIALDVATLALGGAAVGASVGLSVGSVFIPDTPDAKELQQKAISKINEDFKPFVGHISTPMSDFLVKKFALVPVPNTSPKKYLVKDLIYGAIKGHENEVSKYASHDGNGGYILTVPAELIYLSAANKYIPETISKIAFRFSKNGRLLGVSPLPKPIEHKNPSDSNNNDGPGESQTMQNATMHM